MSTKPWKRSEEDKRDQYRSISQHTRYWKGVQGGAIPPRHARPGRWIQLGLTPPQWFSSDDPPEREPEVIVCDFCDEEADVKDTYPDGSVAYHHGTPIHEAKTCREDTDE